MEQLMSSDKYKFCNHHHELTDNHEVVDFGDGQFVANKEAIPLLKALNDLGIRTRSHHVDDEGGFFSMILNSNIRFEIKEIFEIHTERDRYNGKFELMIFFDNKTRGNDQGKA